MEIYAEFNCQRYDPGVKLRENPKSTDSLSMNTITCCNTSSFVKNNSQNGTDLFSESGYPDPTYLIPDV